MAFLAGKEAVRGQSQWRHSELKEKIVAQPRKDHGAPLILDGGGPVPFAWVAEECNRVSGLDLTAEGERVYADLVGKTKRDWICGDSSKSRPRMLWINGGR